MNRPVEPKEFWENKILDWETGRYKRTGRSASLLESVANRASMSLRFRLATAIRLLAPHVEGRRVVELGCGSGLLATHLIALGTASYQGFDFAANAVELASRRAAEDGISDRARFEVCAVADLGSLEADIVVSLGLFDWLDDDELDTIFRVSGEADYLHAIAERSATPTQWLHRLYVHLAYGHRTGSYVPRYYSTAEIEDIIRRHGAKPMRVVRARRISFGAILTSLPDEVPHVT